MTDNGVTVLSESRPARRRRGDRRVAPPVAGAPAFSDDTVNLIDLWRILWHRRRLIGGIVALATVATVVAVYLITPTYKATANVMLDLRQERVVNYDSVLSGLVPDPSLIESEVQVVRSRPVAEHVIAALNLIDDPGFNPAVDPTATPAWRRSAADMAMRAADLLPGDGGNWLRARAAEFAGLADKDLSQAERTRREKAQVLERYYEALDVQPVGRSYVFEVAFEWTDPTLAAQIANEVAQQYVARQLEAKADATIQANQWLSKRLKDLRSQLIESERAVVAYKKKFGLAEVADMEVTAQQLSELNAKMALARAERAAAEARLNQVVAARDRGGPSAIPDVLASPLMHNLREGEAQLQRELLALKRQYVPGHPEIADAEAQLAELRKAIKEEIARYVSSLEGEAKIARARENTLAADIEQLKTAVNKVGGTQVELHDLQQQAEVNRTLYEGFLRRYNETYQQQDIQRPDARVISKAGIPEYPVWPQKKLLVALAGITSLGFAAFVVLMLERVDRGFRDAEDAEHHTGLPALGLMALEKPRLIGASSPADLVKKRPLSLFAESTHSLLANLMLASGDRPPRVVMITSAVPEEGKTITAVALARAAALSGRRTLLIDADMRRPSVFSIVGQPVVGSHPPGLTEVLKGEFCFAEVVVRDRLETGLYVLPAGTSPGGRPLDMQSSARMKHLLATELRDFDMIVMDCSPVMAAADTSILATMSDAIVMVAQWHKTPRKVVDSALRQLRNAQIEPAGLALTQVDVAQLARYGSGSYGYYAADRS
jgi:capsular exopolysaccharide synthesis family protein